MKRLTRKQMAWRAAQDIKDGWLVNLGIGIPVLAADYLSPERDVFIQAENGIIGCGPLAPGERGDQCSVIVWVMHFLLRRRRC